MTEIADKLFEELELDAGFETLELELKQYCPFEAMRTQNHEIRHSNFLAYMMDRFRPHGYGNKVLTAFLNAVANYVSTLPSSAGRVSSDLFNSLRNSTAEVRREWQSIDMLVEFRVEKVVVAIELKINAIQSKDQLLRYKLKVEQEWPKSHGWQHLLIFLTKNEEPPQDPDWIPVRLSTILPALVMLQHESACALARDNFQAYLRMLRRVHVGNELHERIARQLWSKHQEVLEYLLARKPDPIQDLLDTVKPIILDALRNHGGTENSDWVLDDCERGNLRFAFTPWDALTKFQTSDWTSTKRSVLFELKLQDNILKASVPLCVKNEEVVKKYGKVLQIYSKAKLGSGKNNKPIKYVFFANLKILKKLPDNFASQIEDAEYFQRTKEDVLSKFVPFVREWVQKLDGELKSASQSEGELR